VDLAAAAGMDFLGSFFGADEEALDDDDEAVAAAAHTDTEHEVEPPQDPEQPPQTYDDESFPPAAQRKLAAQAAYIIELEDERLNLRERVFLLEQQLAEMRRGGPRGASPSVHEAPSEDEAGREADAEPSHAGSSPSE
jgi:hypothetical protein